MLKLRTNSQNFRPIEIDGTTRHGNFQKLSIFIAIEKVSIIIKISNGYYEKGTQ